jgi:hypothetical protein
LVWQLTAKSLLTEFVLEGVEKYGFNVSRIVGDKTSTNVKMFRMWSPDGKLVPFIQNSFDENRLLFSALATHIFILKNICN